MLIHREKVKFVTNIIYNIIQTTDSSFEYQLLGENMNIPFEDRKKSVLTCRTFTYLNTKVTVVQQITK